MNLKIMPPVVEHRFDAKSDSKAPVLSVIASSPLLVVVMCQELVLYKNSDQEAQEHGMIFKLAIRH